MARKRNRHRPQETKVWRDPHVKAGPPRSAKAEEESSNEPESNDDAAKKRRPARRIAGRIVASAKPVSDPRELEKQRMIERLLEAEGRTAITRTANAYLAADFEYPATNQDLWLQLLEHQDEETIRTAIEHLSQILKDEPANRRAVLESRLRRIEEFAEEKATQDSAAGLRRSLSQLDAARTED